MKYGALTVKTVHDPSDIQRAMIKYFVVKENKRLINEHEDEVLYVVTEKGREFMNGKTLEN